MEFGDYNVPKLVLNYNKYIILVRDVDNGGSSALRDGEDKQEILLSYFQILL